MAKLLTSLAKKNFFSQLLYLESGFLSVAYFAVANLARLGISFIVRPQSGPSIQTGSSLSAGLQVVTQPTHLWKNRYPKLVSNPHRSKIRPPTQLDYRCMPPLHPVTLNTSIMNVRKGPKYSLHLTVKSCSAA